MKIDVVVEDCWWTHEFILGLLLSMLLMIIHGLGVDKCVVVVKFLCLCENGQNEVNFNVDEFKWIQGMSLLI